MKKWFYDGYFTVAISLLTPVAFFMSRNYTQQSELGNVATLAVAAAAGIVAALLCALVFRFAPGSAIAAGRTSPSSGEGKPGDATPIPAPSRRFRHAVFAAAFAALFPFCSFVFGDSGNLSGLHILLGFLASVAVIYYFMIRIGCKAVNVFLAAFLAISLINVARAELGARGAAFTLPPPATIPHSFRMKKRPNIYFFLLESFHDRETLKREYDFDMPEFFERFRRDGFVEFPGFYSNYVGTLEANIAILSMRHHYNKFSLSMVDGDRECFSLLANNNVFNTVKNNGYGIYVFDSYDFYTFRKRSPLIDYVHFPQEDDLAETMAVFLSYLNPYFGKVVLRIGTAFQKERKERNRAPDIFYEKYPGDFDLESKPAFFYFHFGAQHIQGWSKLYPSSDGPDSAGKSWKQEFPNFYANGASHVQRHLDLILRHDPDALIVMVGDHGAWKHGRELGLATRPEFYGGGEDVNGLFRSHDLEPAAVASNLASVFAAIRWPKDLREAGVPVPERGISHVTLFPYIFCALNGIEYDDRLFDDNTGIHLIFFEDRYLVFARDGKLLKNWTVERLTKNGLTKE